jgi:hypothetical protein
MNAYSGAAGRSTGQEVAKEPGRSGTDDRQWWFADSVTHS